MATREEAKLLDPNANFGVGWQNIYVDDNTLKTYLINWFLERIGSRKRARVIVFEDAVRGEGIWTPEEAGDVANRLVIGKDGNYVDPQRKSGFFGLLQNFGWMK